MAKKREPNLIHCKLSQVKNPRAPWRVSFTVDQDGKAKRVFKSFSTEEKAWSFAEKRELEIANHGTRFGDITPEVRRAFDFYRDEVIALAELGVEVPRFESLVSTALADIRARHVKSKRDTLTIAEGVAAFIGYKQTRVKARQIIDLKTRLKRFAQDFGTDSIESITTATVEQWLSSLRSRKNPDKLAEAAPLGPLSRNHYRATLHSFFAHAAAKGRKWIPHNPVADTEPEQVEDGEPEAYTPEDAARIMQTAMEHKPALIPVLALGMFAGLRVSEAIEAQLEKLSFNDDEFRVGSDRKTGSRMAPFTPACKAWLAAQPRKTGKAWLISPRMLVDEMQELIAMAKVEQIFNGARHSFISYRTAETRDVSRAADECGNSVQVIKKKYRKIVTTEAAKKFFAIRPAKVGKSKITDIETGRRTA